MEILKIIGSFILFVIAFIAGLYFNALITKEFLDYDIFKKPYEKKRYRDYEEEDFL